MASLFNIEDSFDPRDDLMGTGIGWLIQVNDTVFKIILERSFKGSGSCGNGSVVVSEHIHLVIVFEEQGPIFGLDSAWLIRGLNNELVLDNFFFCHYFFFL